MTTTVHRVVAGVDGSAGSRAALRFAHDEAVLRGVPLVPVMAWSYLDQHHADGSKDFRADYHPADATAALEAIVNHEIPATSDVTIDPIVTNDLAAAGILSVIRDDDLLVVGARGHGGFRGMLLGSVSQHLISHAPCPVTVVRQPPSA